MDAVMAPWPDAEDGSSGGVPARGAPNKHIVQGVGAGLSSMVVVALLAAAVAMQLSGRQQQRSCAHRLAHRCTGCQNGLDTLASLFFLGYGVWLIVVHKARTIVFVPVFVLASLFALMVFLSALGASVRSCSCVLALSSAVGVGLAIGEVAVGITAYVKPDTVVKWLRDMEDSTVSAHFDSNHVYVAVFLWVLAALQLVRAASSCIVEAQLARKQKEESSQGFVQAGKGVYVSGASRDASYKNWPNMQPYGYSSRWTGSTKADYKQYLKDAQQDWHVDEDGEWLDD